MAMSKKDYETIARALAAHTHTQNETQFDAGWTSAAREIAIDLAHICANDNPRFDRARFLKACGIGEGE